MTTAYGWGDDLGDLRSHGLAHALLYHLARGLVLEVRDGAVWLVDPAPPEGSAAADAVGREPVPLAVLDAVEAAGWVAVDAAGCAITRKGLWHLDRWGYRRYTRASWERERATFTGRVAE